MGHKKLTNDNPSEFYPDFLKSAKQRTLNDLASDKPNLVHMAEAGAQDALKKILKDNPHVEIVDNYDEQYAELLLSRNAHLYRANYDVQVASISKLLDEHFEGRKPWTLGTWVHFPWRNQLVHILAQRDFEDLRTIRNRDLITSDEQTKLFDFEAVCFGMSVGSAGALALGISGISRRMKLVDGAVISGSNLNRILTGVSSVGQSKAITIARQIYEMNPYSEVHNFDKVDVDNIGAIFDEPWQVKIAIDEIDDIEMKVRIRAEARKRQIPVLMATELGDTIMLDVERYDLEPNRPLFHNLVPGVDELLEKKVENYREWTKHAVSIIDPHNMPMKMQQSLLKIGNTIVTHPQLGSTVMVTGGMLAFAAKNIALGNPLESGRYVISLEKEMLADHKTRNYKRSHKKHTKVIKAAINSM
jgi:hypothetical protein